MHLFTRRCEMRECVYGYNQISLAYGAKMMYINEKIPGAFNMKSSIVSAGYAGIDIIKTIEAFPERHGLVSITNISMALGGAVCNCGVDMAKLSPETIIKPMAMYGDDQYGSYMMEELNKLPNMDTSLMIRDKTTGFTDVLDEAETKVRTFLVHRGSNSLFDVDTVDVDALDCGIFHIGYICLMTALDSPDDRYGSRMARLLHKVQRSGILTSVDAVTDATGRHRTLMPAAMKYADIMCVNEHEAGAAFGVELRKSDGTLDEDGMLSVLRKFREHGVAKWAVIHAPECAMGLDENSQPVFVPGVKLPEGYIKGTVGAGDAFVSGLLLGAKDGLKLYDAINDGIAAAVTSLSEAGASDGVTTMAEARARLKALRG